MPEGAPPRDFRLLRNALASGQRVSDRRFDVVYPRVVRRASEVHWTPVRVAVRAAQFLADTALQGEIVDVGAGVGKFCIVAAAVSAGATVRGVEHRAHYVEVGRAAVRAFGVDVDLCQGTVDDVDPEHLAGVYLFNPFFENTCPPEDHLDTTVELSEARYRRDVAATEGLLARARPGTRVAVYCGFGGTMPEAYEKLADQTGAGILELWVKRNPASV